LAERERTRARFGAENLEQFVFGGVSLSNLRASRKPADNVKIGWLFTAYWNHHHTATLQLFDIVYRLHDYDFCRTHSALEPCPNRCFHQNPRLKKF
jgi:hypothetical protein